nr:protein FAM47E isoform X4 [Desmodus rotundus]
MADRRPSAPNRVGRNCKPCPKRTSLSPQGPLLYEKKKPNEMDSLHEDGSPLYENARRAVNDFCKWTGDIASVKIEEEFVTKQFHLDYQSKPSCYGLHMMRPNQLPLELKKSVGLNKWQEAEFFKEREQKLEEELLSFAKLYGPAAFKEFILRKGYRMPSFLEKINVRKDVNASVKRVL